MKLKFSRFIDFFLRGLFVFTLICFISRVFGVFNPTEYHEKEIKAHLTDDEFDIRLSRLNTLDKLLAYCDSLYQANSKTLSYPGTVSRVLRNRFFHGYSYYTVKTNPLAVIFEPLVKKGAHAIVIPEDIVKYPMAACSQQSIIGMEIFKRRGYPVRKVSMYDSVMHVGHFAFEVFYNGSWHYFDTNQEPDFNIIEKYNRPSVAFLAQHPQIVEMLYCNKKDPTLFQRLIKSYKTGVINRLPAPNGIIYQKITKFLNFFGWFFILMLIMIRRRKLDGMTEH